MPQNWPEHIQWLVLNRGTELGAVLRTQGAHPDVKAALAVLVDADPSPGLHAVQWLCTALLGGGMRWEDVAGGAGSKAGETLQWFSQHRRALPRGQRNLEDHASLASLYRALQPLLPSLEVEPTTGRVLRRAQRQQAYKDSIVLCQSPELIVVVPTTRQASCWWGRGTRWCTAADKNNMFDTYNQTAPLIIAILLAGKDRALTGGQDIGLAGKQDGGLGSQSAQRNITKLQLHISSDDDSPDYVQFMDEADDWVSPRDVWKNWSRLEPLIRWGFERSPLMLEYIPYGLRTYDMCTTAVSFLPATIEFVPKHLLDTELCMLAISRSEKYLSVVPPHLLTEDFYLQAIERNPSVFHAIPLHLRANRVVKAAIVGMHYDSDIIKHAQSPTLEICWLAVRTNPDALAHVPAEFISAQMCMEAVRACGRVLEWVPRHLMDADMCMVAMEQHGQAIMCIDHALQTPAMALQACKTYGMARYVRPDLLTPELLMQAVATTPRVIEELHGAQLTPELCMQAVQSKPGLLRVVAELAPEKLVPEIYMAAVKAAGLTLKYVPEHMRTYRMCLNAVDNCCYALRHVPTSLKDEDMHAIAIARLVPPDLVSIRDIGYWESPCMLESIEPRFRTREVCQACVAIQPDSLKFVPPHLLDMDMYRTALAKSADAIRHVPYDMSTHELYIATLAASPLCLQHIDPGVMTQQMCSVAVAANGAAIKYMPMHMKTLDLCVQASRSSQYGFSMVPPDIREAVRTACLELDAAKGPGWNPDILASLAAALADGFSPGLAECSRSR